MTFYAFPGEIVGEPNGNPEFHVCEAVREQAAAALRDDRWDVTKRAARVGLLMLLGVSLGMSAWRTLAQVQEVRGPQLCAVCRAAAAMTQRIASGCGADVFGAVSIGALAAAQPCSVALLAGALALAWKPRSGPWRRVTQACALVAGAGVANATLAGVVAWSVARVLGVAVWGAGIVAACRGPMLIVVGALLTGVLGKPMQSRPVVWRPGGLLGMFFLGSVFGGVWCPVSLGLFAGVLLPISLVRGTPLRDSLLYGAGYALSLLVVCAILAAGCRMARLSFIGRFVSAAAGCGLILLGVWIGFY